MSTAIPRNLKTYVPTPTESAVFKERLVELRDSMAGSVRTGAAEARNALAYAIELVEANQPFVTFLHSRRPRVATSAPCQLFTAPTPAEIRKAEGLPSLENIAAELQAADGFELTALQGELLNAGIDIRDDR